MNDQTPRRFQGSLLERAAAQYQFVPVARPVPVAPVREPAPERESLLAKPAPVAPVIPAREPAPEREALLVEPAEPQDELLLTETELELLLDTPLDSDELVLDTAAPEPEYMRFSGGRRTARIDRELLAEGGMLVPGGPIMALAEEFRMVKRQLLLTARAVAAKDTARAADKARMILVGSARPNEGKTFCAINLALSMAAEKDVEILLVDADFAKPDVMNRLGLASGPGLLDALSGAVQVEDCIVHTDIPQLSVLPAGTRSVSDTELLASNRAHAILDGLASANPQRIVIFDTPPALAASPASVLALHVGQVLVVVRADQTSESDLRDAVNTLDGCEHIQLVLNSVSFQPGGHRFGNYYGETAQ